MRAALGALLLWAALAAACGEASPRPRRPLGEPVPSASTSAEPQWLRSP